MIEYWQHLLYPLGFLSALPFTGRFLIQWIQSEKAKKSVVRRSFWILSLFGSITLALHSLLQIQYTVALIQSFNSVISFRNLELMSDKQKKGSLSKVIVTMVAVFTLITALFALEGIFFNGGQIMWMRSPEYFWESKPLSLPWHLFGLSGLILFTSRFWIQWIQSERKQKSHLSATFWSLSLVGALISVTYFYWLGDLVNLIGPGVGIFTYARNLQLIRKQKALANPG